jgi:hypothetical protein
LPVGKQTSQARKEGSAHRAWSPLVTEHGQKKLGVPQPEHALLRAHFRCAIEGLCSTPAVRFFVREAEVAIMIVLPPAAPARPMKTMNGRFGRNPRAEPDRSN